MENVVKKIKSEVVENIENFVKLVLSETKTETKKIVVRPIIIKDKLLLQF